MNRVDPAEELATALSAGTVAVLSDVHANGSAMRAAAADLAARRPQVVVVLGDLLTYGCEPLEVLDTLDRLSDTVTLFMIAGNHDQLYFRGAGSGTSAYLHRLPGFVRESVEWTARLLDGHALEERFVWREQLTVGSVLCAHANPFGYGDWTYLNSEPDLRRAAEALVAGGRLLGVFGHTHRRQAVIVTEGVLTALGTRVPLTHDLQRGAAILNPGSVGQPRGGGSSMLYLHGDPHGLRIEFVDLVYDVAAHTRAIEAAQLSDETKRRLLAFFGAGDRR